VLSEKWTGFAAGCVVGMGVWAIALREYHLASKIVKPRLEFLKVKEDELAEAQTSLAKAEADLKRSSARRPP
jgi:dynein heavy chain